MSPVCAIIQADHQKTINPGRKWPFCAVKRKRLYVPIVIHALKSQKLRTFQYLFYPVIDTANSPLRRKSLIGEFAQDFGNHFSQWSDINDHCILSPSCFSVSENASLSMSCVTKLNSEYSIFGGIRLLAHSGLSAPVSLVFLVVPC